MDIEEIYQKITKINKEKLKTSNTNCGIVDKNVDNILNLQNNIGILGNNGDNSIVNKDIVRENKYQCGVLIENTDFIQKFQDKIKIDFINENGEIVETPTNDTLEMVDKLFEEVDGEIVEEGFVTKDVAKYLIINKLEPTMENIYKAKYAGKNIVIHNIAEEDFEALKEQVSNIIVDSGYEVTEENLEVSKWLIEHDIPLCKDTFDKY